MERAVEIQRVHVPEPDTTTGSARRDVAEIRRPIVQHDVMQSGVVVPEIDRVARLRGYGVGTIRLVSDGADDAHSDCRRSWSRRRGQRRVSGAAAAAPEHECAKNGKAHAEYKKRTHP